MPGSHGSNRDRYQHGKKKKKGLHTEADTRVFLAHVLALLVGEEHVGGQATLGGVGVCEVKTVSLTVSCNPVAKAKATGSQVRIASWPGHVLRGRTGM